MALTQLFGGAIQSAVPENFLDVSKFRQVPDTQEVFASERSTDDDSVVFDILEMVNPTDNEKEKYHYDLQAFETHLDEIAKLNGVGSGISSVNVGPVKFKNLGYVKRHGACGSMTSLQEVLKKAL